MRDAEKMGSKGLRGVEVREVKEYVSHLTLRPNSVQTPYLQLSPPLAPSSTGPISCLNILIAG
jgi:hypothetical protein